MAVVYRAEDVILGRTVALKTLRERYAEDLAFQRRFKQEARAMASLDHPNIVKVYDISQDGEVPVIVAECIEGEDVGRILTRRGRTDPGWALQVVEQLLSALSYAHERGIVHRDVKPSNILMTGDGSVKVADFGIASLPEQTTGGSWESGEIIGSARYMAPEQLTGGVATPQSDLYSVGILLYHCLTGEPPFSGDTRTVARRQLQESPVPPRRLNRKIPPELDREILKVLSKDPEERHATASEMRRDLRETRSSGGSVVPAGLSSLLGERRRRLLLAPAVAVLLAGGGMAYGLSGSQDVELPSLSATGSVEQGSVEAPEPQQAAQEEGGQDQAPGEAAEPGATVPETEETEEAGGSRDNEGSSEEAGGSQDTEGGSEATEEYVRVPNTDQYFDYWAAEVLESRGFEVEIVYEYRDRYANRGVTWATEPAAGSEAPAGSTITIYSTPLDEPQPQL
ncbi:MAG: serine/threonine protein kinase [Rubrobacter sp.]|nr:serine/threonine protein kinase [Rubrobacter sp.]